MSARSPTPGGQERNAKPTGSAAARPRFWRVSMLVVAILAAGFALIFLAYISSRTDDLTEREFRVLGDKSGHVREALENLSGALLNASQKLTNTPSPIEQFSNVVAGIEPPVTLDQPPNLNSLTNANLPFSATNSELSQGAKGYRFSLTYSDGSTNSFTASVDVGDMLRPILKDSDFADILLTRTNGEVLFQLSQAEDRLIDPDASTDVRMTRLPRLDLTAGTNLAVHGTCLFNITVAGTAYKVFAQPLKVAFGGASPANVDWWLCGLIRAKDFRVATWAIPTPTVVAFIFVAVGLLGLWPFLNIIGSGPGAGVSRIEVAWVLAGSFLGCAALTFVLLYSNAFLGSEQASDQDLKNLAGEIRANVVNEISEVDHFLTTQDLRLLKAATNTSQGGANLEAWRKLSQKTNAYQGTVNSTGLYPSIVEVFWIGRGGIQVAKWTPRHANTAFVRVADRAYFRSIVGHRGWPSSDVLTNEEATNNHVFYVESIFSKTRGENLAVLSHPFPGSADEWPPNNPDYPAVSAMTFRPLSLFSPVLPPGYGFCIIEPNGRVLFHSDGNRNLRENFIVEAGQDRRLESAVYARTEEAFDVRYLNVAHNLEVMPMRGFPWTIIAFRDERLLGGVHRNILLTGCVLFVTYLLALALGLLFRAALAGACKALVRERNCGGGGWWWPEDPAHPKYIARGLLAGVLSVLGAIAVARSGAPEVLLVWVLAAPVVILPLSWVLDAVVVRFRRELSRMKDKLQNSGGKRLLRLFSSPNLYWIHLGLILVLFAMLPAFACYKIAFEKEMELYVKGTQLQVARDLQERPTPMRRRWTRGWRTGAGGSGYWRFARAARRTNYHGLNRYLSFFGAMTATNVEVPSQDNPAEANVWPGDTEWFTALYGAIRPRFAEVGLQTGSLLSAKADDDSWRSYDISNRLAVISVGSGGTNATASIMVSSQVPELSWLTGSFDEIPVWRYCWYLGFAAALLTPFLFSRFIARNLLLFSLPPSLRQKRVIRHMHIQKPLPAPGDDDRKEHAFEAIEHAFIQVRAGSKTVEDGAARERGAIIIVRVPEEGTVEHWVEALEQPDRRTQTVVFVSDSECPPGLWNLSLNSERAPKQAPDQAVTNTAVLYRVGDKFRETWADCTGWEKLTLYEVAKRGFTNASRPQLRTLLQRDLLRFGPELCLRNESFRRFVLATFQTDEVARELHDAGAGSLLSWRTIRGPLAIVISAGALFLFATQQELWQLAIGVAGSFAAAIQGLSRITSLFQKGKGDTPGSSQA